MDSGRMIPGGFVQYMDCLEARQAFLIWDRIGALSGQARTIVRNFTIDQVFNLLLFLRCG